MRSSVQLWDVSCQRQVEVRGPEAAYLVQMMTPRDLGSAVVGQCLYAPLIDDKAGLINDPVILKRAEDWYWLSIADSDVLLWAKGLALGLGIDVAVTEPDVSPLAVQGPRAEDLVAAVFGDAVRNWPIFVLAVLIFLIVNWWLRVPVTASKAGLRSTWMTAAWELNCGMRCGRQVRVSM